MSGQELHRRTTEAKTLSTNLNGLVSPSSGFFDSSLDLDDILRATCKAAVDLLKVDHSGLVVFDSLQETGQVISEYPPRGLKGSTIRLLGIPAEEQMLISKEPLAIANLSQDTSFSIVSDLLRKYGIRSVLVIPLVNKDVVIGSLGLDMIDDPREFNPEEIKLAQMFAEQAAAVIELYRQNKQKAEQLAAIQSMASALTSAQKDLRSVLDALTRQAVQLLGGKDGGISQFIPGRDLKVISDYKDPSLIGTTITVFEGLAGEVIRKDLPFKSVPDYSKYAEKAPVYARNDRFGAIMIINLKWQHHTVGVMYINARRGYNFPTELSPLLTLLASTAAIAIANAHLLQEAKVSRERINSSFQIATAIASQPDSKLVAQEIADRTLKAANAAWVNFVIFDDNSTCHIFRSPATYKATDTKRRIRLKGITRQVLDTGQPYYVKDVNKEPEKLNDIMLKKGCAAAMCLPLSFKGPHRGVMWIYYLAPRKFNKNDLQPLSAYLAQASIAYDNTRQMEALEPLRQVVESLATATGVKDVMERIVRSAKELFKSDYAVLWPYPDSKTEVALPIREAVTAGISEEFLEGLRDWAIPIGEIIRLIMREGWLPVPDIAETAQVRLPEISTRVLHLLGVKSFAGLGLLVAEEKLGLLYLLHRDKRDFNAEETRAALTFATHAALALKKAKLVEQAAKNQMATMRAAELSALAALVDLEATLARIVESTKETLQCDAVTLFVYSEESDRILPLTTMTGVYFPKRATHCQNAPRDSIVYQMLRRDERAYISRVADDDLFHNQPFALREKIKSVCAIPLKVNEHRVGVMFINYRRLHTFSNEELDQIDPLVKQAGAVILSGLRYKGQSDLAKLSTQLLGAGSLQDSLSFAVKEAAEILVADFVAIVLPDVEGLTRIPKWLGWTEEEIRDYEQHQGEMYQTGYTIREGMPVIVSDYSQENRFEIPSIVSRRNIQSGISVPMLSGNKPVGAMLVHFLSERPFIEAQARTLSLIANLTAISVQHHQAVDSKLASLTAVQRAADELSKIRLGTPLKEVLDKIVEQTIACLPQSFLATIQRYDNQRNVLRFETVYPASESERLVTLVGEERLLKRRPGNTIGIAGRTVLERKAQLVDDVSIDPDYYRYSEETKSELVVPLLTEDGEVLGVINVESKRLAAYNEDDKQALLTLSKLVVTTIQNAEQYRLLEGSILLAWFGMASSTWGHSVAGNSLLIQDNVTLLRRQLDLDLFEPDVRTLIDEELNLIDDVAAQILEKPMMALLHLSEGVSEVDINQPIYARVEQLWRHSPYKNVHHDLQLTPEPVYVRCNPDWIKRMLDILIDNALDAMARITSPAVTIKIALIEGELVEITITDRGPGIPLEIRDKLFKQIVQRPMSAKGFGIGLLMAQVIAERYMGKIGVRNTGPQGTTMYVRLPVVAGNHQRSQASKTA